MKVLIATVLALGIALPAAAQTAAASDCDVSVRFGSYAMGIDQKSFDRVERYAVRHKRLVAHTSVERWGREGERTVCIDTRSRRATNQVFSDLKRLIRTGAERGPTELAAADGRVWRANPGPPR
ncbi:MAG: hypothetical protein V4466_06335 [Pseudomonadota bacterium]